MGEGGGAYTRGLRSGINQHVFSTQGSVIQLLNDKINR